MPAHAQRPTEDPPPSLPSDDELDAWYRAALAETMRPCPQYHQPVEPAEPRRPRRAA